MKIRVYHCSPVANLTTLKPHQCRSDDSPYFGLFLAPTLRDILIWRGRLFQERKIDPCYLYSVVVDPAYQILFCDGEKRRKRWRGERETLGNQIWIAEELPCRSEDFISLLEKAPRYDLLLREEEIF